ncbi:MAG: nicotinate (nicotinamide) nucleotide adenylyltransferase [Bacilli bacterium]|nr:nicotinate (nicotinamide) nucleotide adenylyltransferase [Bacilli bacterium]
MNIIIFGGSFDPVHLGHVKIASYVAERYDATLYFVPAKISVWKHESVSIEDKLNMLKLAIGNNPRLKIDEFELNRPDETTYSIETVRYFKKKFPGDKLYFLMGADQARSFHKWQEALEISRLAKILYYPRDDIRAPIDNILQYQMELVDGGLYKASATDIRSLSSLYLDEKVLNYILEHELYFVKKVKSMYSPKRYEHALSVARTAIEIARSNNLLYDRLFNYFFLAGYLHDIAKALPKEEAKQMMAHYYPEYIDMPEFSYHQFLGAHIAQEEFGINDQYILDAIKYHATGRKHMSDLEKIIFASDKIEPNRPYDSKDLIEAMKKDYKTGFITVLKNNKKFLLDQGKNISNPLTDECLAYYLKNE